MKWKQINSYLRIKPLCAFSAIEAIYFEQFLQSDIDTIPLSRNTIIESPFVVKKIEKMYKIPT